MTPTSPASLIAKCRQVLADHPGSPVVLRPDIEAMLALLTEQAQALQEIQRENDMLRGAAPDRYLEKQLQAADARCLALEAQLRSAHAIAARKGVDTAWERFAASCQALGIGSVTARTYRVLPSDGDEPLTPSSPESTP